MMGEKIHQANSWAIVALAKPAKLMDITKRNKKIAAKIRPFAKQHNITVLFFSEKEFTTAAVTSWRETFAGLATVRYINTASNGFELKQRYGYKYMCKFFALDIYDYLVKEYNYYMRVDTDCYLENLNYDIFKWAEDNKVEYSFAARKLEAHKETRQTLPQFSEDYMQKCSVTPSAVMDVPFSTCINFYNNWHIAKVDFFVRPDVRHFLLSVNASGGILQHRWGDSTIQAYAVRMFMDPSHLKQAPEFSYTHGSHNALVSTFGDGSKSNVPQRLENWKHSPTRT